MDSRRQKKISSLLQKELSEILQKDGASYTNGSLVTVMQVDISPDLMNAKAYLSIFNADDPDQVLKNHQAASSEIRRKLGNSLKNHLRRIPEIHFVKDSTLDDVFNLENILNKDKED